MKGDKTKVWEVYIRDSQSGCLFLTENEARNQNVFSEVDLISPAEVDLTKDEIGNLKKGIPVFF